MAKTRIPRLAATAGLLAALGAGAAPAAEQDFRIWENVTAIAGLGAIDPGLDKWRLWLEGQGRFRDEAGAADQVLARGGVGYQLSDRASVWLGYAFVGTFPQGRRKIDEHRIWQQLLLTEKAPFGDLTSRARLEQRFIQGVDPVEWRFREMLRWSRPLFEGSPVSAVVWDEIFIRLNSTAPSARFGVDQNRAFAGLAYSFSKQARVEVGYLNQYLLSRSVTRAAQRFDDRINHILSFNLFLNL